MTKLYQAQTAKAIKNFQITGQSVTLDLIYAVTEIKKAAAKANLQTGRLTKPVYQAIKKACDQITKGKHDQQFVTDQLQGGAGTSINMNVNEVIASLAEKLLLGQKIHANDHVNLGQSTNDVIPTAIKLMMLRQLDQLVSEMKNLEKAFLQKCIEYRNIVKVARTHLQDAVPMTLGQSFKAYASFIARNRLRLEENRKYLLTTNLGGTAVGTAINSSKSYIKYANLELAELTGYAFEPSSDLIDATQNSDNFLHYASLLKTLAAGLAKISNDLRMLASGPRAGLGELILPEMQNGSSIMPGKVNPVILELLNQICYQVFGNVESAFHASLNSQFELNAMLPVYAKNIHEAFTILTHGIRTLTEKVVVGIKPDLGKIKQLFDNSLCMATALNRYIGYDKAADLVKKAIKNNASLLDELKKSEVLDAKTIAQIFDPEELTKPNDKFIKPQI